MTAQDLQRLDNLLSTAAAVVAMEDIHDGEVRPDVIGLRHDVDDNAGSLATAVRMARWESERGYRSTYFILHGSSYWLDEQRLRRSLEEIAAAGHEIAIHGNAIAEALTSGGTPAEILSAAVAQLRGYGYPVRGFVAHGDRLCHQVGFVNDEMFVESRRETMGAADRELVHTFRLSLQPIPLGELGLDYDSNRLPRGYYISDSGGAWNVAPDKVDFPACGQLHILQHPDWWANAL